jgi:hypothetical protein
VEIKGKAVENTNAVLACYKVLADGETHIEDRASLLNIAKEIVFFTTSQERQREVDAAMLGKA